MRNHKLIFFIFRTLHILRAMASKGAKETLVSKLGFKSNSSGSKADAELERVRKENAHLRKKMDELAKRHIKPPDSDKSKLLEVQGPSFLSPLLCIFVVIFKYMRICFLQRILSLETLRERNNQQLLVKEQELEALRQQLSAKGGEVSTQNSENMFFPLSITHINRQAEAF